ncbi:SprT-like domain-containing protein [Propionibacterium sp.]|uniref:M48 family metallopeptidase n=1 Tax=Propionibacterium sp. TaxID=1977903 RepID=UPI0039EC2F03
MPRSQQLTPSDDAGGHRHPDRLLEIPHGAELPPRVTHIVVRASSRRKRTVELKSEQDRLVLMVPAGLSARQESDLAKDLLAKLARRRARPGLSRDDASLAAKAENLRSAYLPEVPEPVSVRWATNQTTRWGSCTSLDRTIRISSALRQMPDWVLDYVLVHELAHLRHPGHGAAFQEMVERFPRAERAKGYLQGWSQARG